MNHRDILLEAVALLRMIDRTEASHPDVAEYLSSVETRIAEADAELVACGKDAVDRVRSTVVSLWRNSVQPAVEAIERAHRLGRENEAIRKSLVARARAEDVAAAKLGVNVDQLRAWLRAHGRATRADKMLVIGWVRTLLMVVEAAAQ